MVKTHLGILDCRYPLSNAAAAKPLLALSRA
jgi:hypothetical protein